MLICAKGLHSFYYNVYSIEIHVCDRLRGKRDHVPQKLIFSFICEKAQCPEEEPQGGEKDQFPGAMVNQTQQGKDKKYRCHHH